MEADDEDFDPEGGNVADEAEQVRMLARHTRLNDVQTGMVGLVGLESTVSAAAAKAGVRSHPHPAFSPGCWWCQSPVYGFGEQLRVHQQKAAAGCQASRNTDFLHEHCTNALVSPQAGCSSR